MAEELSSYLKRLTFNSRMWEGVGAGLITNVRVTLLLVMGILVMGSFALASLPRRINPEVNIPIVFVSTAFPGASPADVEKLVTVPLENAVEGVEGITQISSSSQENFSSVVIEFSSKVNTDEVVSEVQRAVAGLGVLPEEASEPKVQALDFEDVPVLQFALVGKTDPVSLNNFAKELREKLEDEASVARVQTVGLYADQVEVLLSEEKYAQYGVSPVVLRQAVVGAIQGAPVGMVQTNGNQMSVAIETNRDAIEILRALPISVGEQDFVLGGIAEISLKSNPNDLPSYYTNGDGTIQPAVSLAVYKTVAADLEEAALTARKLVADEVAQKGGLYEVKIVSDFAEDIDDQFGDLVSDFGSSIALVFLTLLLFLGIRQASLASFVIPLSFLATFAAMYFFDIQLSFLSLFSLLLGLGMIVDDAIVMISAMTDYYASGKFSPKETALLVWNDYKSPTLSSNLTNVWSFLPLLIATGIIGEFTKVISIVVSVALVTSTAISLIVTIPLMSVVLQPHVPKRVMASLGLLLFAGISGLWIALLSGNALVGLGLLVYILLLVTLWLTRKELMAQMRRVSGSSNRVIGWLERRQIKDKLLNGTFSAKKPIRIYKQRLLELLKDRRKKRRMIGGVVALAVGSYLLVPLGLVKQEFFPSVDQDNLYVTLEMPKGTVAEVTEMEALTIAKRLSEDESVDYVLVDLGAGADFGSTSQQNQSNVARFSLKLIADRDQSSIELAQTLRADLTDYSKGELNVVEESSGPPAGADVQITLLADDLADLQATAQQVNDYLVQKPDVTNVTVSVEPGLSKIAFSPDLEKLRSVGIDVNALVGLVRSYINDVPLGEIRDDSELCEDECVVVLRLGDGKMKVEELAKVSLPMPNGDRLSLDTLGTFSLQESPTVVTRLNGQRSITISGDVGGGANVVQVGKELTEYVDQELTLPKGMSWQTGGVNEENQKSVNSILQAMIVSAILIMGTMVVELKSFRRALIVMLVIPLAISGVFIVFAIFRIPLSFPALIGVLALFGIVVKNAILIVDKINLNREIGLPFEEAIADGASSRLEPIAFSSVTNIIGLVPITISDPLWRGLGGAIIAGLTLSGVIMLFFIPLLYHSWFKPKNKAGE